MISKSPQRILAIKCFTFLEYHSWILKEKYKKTKYGIIKVNIEQALDIRYPHIFYTLKMH